MRWLNYVAGKATEAARIGSSVCHLKGVDYPTDVRPVVVVWVAREGDCLIIRSSQASTFWVTPATDREIRAYDDLVVRLGV
ncbi:MAG: hypothetical protein JWR85_9 [Marmoricola sp.]|nr:hypothetical protein [Marmoricola sp.]